MHAKALPTVVATALVAVALGATFAQPAAASPRRTVSLYFDAIFTKARFVDKAPAGDSPGDRQIASGPLRDARGRKVGSFSFTCVYKTIVAGDAHERCSGLAKTSDGRIDFAGPAIKSELDHTWSLSGKGAVRGVSGSVVVHDVGDKESLVTATAHVPAGVSLRRGVIVRPAANHSYVGRADRACSAAADQFAKLPPFPFSDFDPLNPDPNELPSVGQFFSGPGNGDPIAQKLIADLGALGRPPAQRREWRSLTSAIAGELASADAQKQAALASQVPQFVATVKKGATLYRSRDVAASLFGAYACRE
jgi:hypothetical protein